MMRVYVKGDRVAWIDPYTTTERTLLGAIPSPIPAGFSGQPSGRIWVASDHRDSALYYSDSTGTTRFITGITRAFTSAASVGRIYGNTTQCAFAASDLWWVTPSGSAGIALSARSEGFRELPNITLLAIYNGAEGSASLQSSIPAPFDITLSDFELFQYLSDAGGTTTCGGAPSSTIIPSITITAGNTSAKVQQQLSTTAVAYQLKTSGATVNGTQVLAGISNSFCLNEYVSYLFLEPQICVSNPITNPSGLKCGALCSEDSDCALAVDGCTKCSGNALQVGTCVEPLDGSGGTRPGGQTIPCGFAGSCINDFECPPECSLCADGKCVQRASD
jgi:hypothetical protein